MHRATIVVTLSNPDRAADPKAAAAKNRLYLEAIERHDGSAMGLDERSTQAERVSAYSVMDGLLISGGADVDPARYGEAPKGAQPHDPGRDALDEEAFAAARERRLPILGICRGLQAVNVFSGGRLVQHVDHHESPPYPARAADATRHGLQVTPGTRLSEILGTTGDLEVNSFHHQAVAPDGLAPGLRTAGLTPHDGVDLVEALESIDPDRWLVAVQCHPERIESSPPQMEALWEAFVASAASRREGRRDE